MRPIRKPSAVAMPLIVWLTRRSRTSIRTRPPHQGASAVTSAASFLVRELSLASATRAEAASRTSTGRLVPGDTVDLTGLEQLLEHLGGGVVQQDVGRPDVRQRRLELAGRLDPGQRAAGGQVGVADDRGEPVGGLAGEQHDVVGPEVGEHAGALGAEEPGLRLLARQAEHGARRRVGAHRVDVRQQVGLALAALEAHPAQPLPRAVVALEELRLGEGGPAQQRQSALVVDDRRGAPRSRRGGGPPRRGPCGRAGSSGTAPATRVASSSSSWRMPVGTRMTTTWPGLTPASIMPAAPSMTRR